MIFNLHCRFRCIKCIKSGITESDATWFSAYTTVLFRVYYGPDTDEFGDTWIGGWIEMKIFAQQCENCYSYITGELDNKRAGYLVRWLHRLIANTYYSYNLRSRAYLGKRTNTKHREDLCEACEKGWCHYRNSRSSGNTE
jgi:hypothetical protein